MKKLLMLIAMVVMGSLAMAQTPISYQAVVRDANNRLAADTTVDVTVQVLTSANVVQFDHSFTDVKTNSNGLLSLLIDDASLSTVNWEKAKFYTKITLGSQVMEDTVPVTAVPYALYALHGGLTPSDSANIFNKIKADSIVLAGRITADSTLFAGRIEDLSDSLNTAYINIKANHDNIDTITLKRIPELKQAIIDTASQIRDWADATFATKVKVKQDSTVLHNALKDTALAIRTWTNNTFLKIDSLKNDTLILKSGTTILNTFVSNAGAAAIEVDVKPKYTHKEEVDSVKNFVGATSVTEMNQMLAALKGNATMFSALQDSLAYIAMDYLAAEMKKDTLQKKLLKTAVEKFAPAVSTLDAKDAKYYINRVKEFKALLPASFKEDVKNELKYRIKNYVNSTEFMNEVKNVLTDATFQDKMATLLNDATVQNAILTNSGVKNIVEKLIIDNVNPTGFTATDVQTAINNAIVNAMGGSAGQSINEAIKNVLPGSVTIEGLGIRTLTW